MLPERKTIAATVLLALLALGGCSTYRIDIQQGNVIKAEQVAQLKVGMTRDQVRFVMGTPLLNDPFHASRWDYVYRLDKRMAKETETKRLALFFDKAGILTAIDGDAATLQSALSNEAREEKSRVYDLGATPPAAK